LITSTESNERILAVDIGGTGLKAALIDRRGRMLTDRLRVKTPQPCPPRVLVRALAALVRPWNLDSSVIGVAVGFPGVVRHGKVVTAPNLGTRDWRGFDLAAALGKLWNRPVRVKNDADLQGLGAARGKGVEVVITLGTGFGSAILVDGWLGPHLEISQHPFRKGETYDQQLGNAALKRIGKKKWNRRVARAIATLRTLTNFDALYIGGGNGRHIRFELPADVRLVQNDCGMRGGAALWRPGPEDPRARTRSP
jgi:polyphosphate glucokinase